MQTSHRFIMVLTILSMLCLLALSIWGQEKAKEYKPTEIQLLKLQNKQKDALLAKQRLESLQAAIQATQKEFQDGLKALTDEAEAVKKENNWPKETQFDPNTVQFSEPPAKEAKKP